VSTWWETEVPPDVTYAESGLAPATGHVEHGVAMVTQDVELICVSREHPLRTMTVEQPGRTLDQRVHVPADLAWDGSWNGCWAFLGEDGRTVYQGQVLRLEPGGHPTSTYAEVPVASGSEYFHGGHGGSGLPVLAGSLRAGELTQSGPIRHKLKVNVYGRRFLSQTHGGHHGRATRADSGYASDLYARRSGTTWFPKDRGDDNFYGGTNPLMGMGTHLAIPPTADLSGLTEPRARRLAEAFRDFGAVIVDNTAENIHAVCAEQGAFVTGAATEADAAFHVQLMDAFTMLRVVVGGEVRPASC
jgi:hypothetical protein